MSVAKDASYRGYRAGKRVANSLQRYRLQDGVMRMNRRATRNKTTNPYVIEIPV
jgi:hypothetical protein